MNNVEHQIQAEAFKVIRLLGKQDPFYATIHAIPNGGKRSIGTAVKLKAEGVLSGVPDIFVPAARMYIEVKAPKGKLSIEQAFFLEQAHRFGFFISVCRSTEDILRVLKYARDMRVKLSPTATVGLTSMCNDAIAEVIETIEKHKKKIAKQGGVKL